MYSSDRVQWFYFFPWDIYRMHVYFSHPWLVLRFHGLIPLFRSGNAEDLLLVHFWVAGCSLGQLFSVNSSSHFPKGKQILVPTSCLVSQVLMLSSHFSFSQDSPASTSWARCRVETRMMTWVLTRPLSSPGLGGPGPARSWTRWTKELSASHQCSIKSCFSTWHVAGSVAELGLPGSWPLVFACWWLISFLFKWTCLPYLVFSFSLFFPFLLSKDGSSTSFLR